MLKRLALVCAFLGLGIAFAGAAEPAPQLRMLLDGFAQHRRVAVGYLRTGNAELGAIEIERLRARWTADKQKLPADLAARPSLAAALTETEALVAQALAAVDAGRIEDAHALMERAASPLRAWRQASGIRLFSDCVLEAGAAYERLDRHRLRTPDLGETAIAQEVVSSAAAAAASYRRCDGEAPPDIRKEAEFRRLLDGMLNSLDQMLKAVGERDAAYLHRLLIEQRSFERLLSFRFG